MIGKSKYRFLVNELVDNKQKITNPKCGWYSIFTFKIEDKIDFSELKYSLIENESIVLSLIDISYYKTKALDKEAIQNFIDILDFFKEYQKDIILRVTYDTKGFGLENEPSDFNIIKIHLRQIIDILNKQKNSVFIFQGLLLGSWGEMHSSKYIDKIFLKELYSIYKKELKKNIYLAFRKPSQIRMILTKEELIKDKYLTLFDDAIFADYKHLGTYGTYSKENWEESWMRQDEIEFINKLLEDRPFGGEVLEGDDFNYLDFFKKSHLTYLNKCHDLKRLEKFKIIIINDMSIYNYLDLYLGYRLIIEEVKTKIAFGKIKIKIKIKNLGFSRVYDELDYYLVLKNKEYKFCNFEVNAPLISGDYYILIKSKSKEIKLACDNKIGTLIKD